MLNPGWHGAPFAPLKAWARRILSSPTDRLAERAIKVALRFVRLFRHVGRERLNMDHLLRLLGLAHVYDGQADVPATALLQKLLWREVEPGLRYSVSRYEGRTTIHGQQQKLVLLFSF